MTGLTISVDVDASGPFLTGDPGKVFAGAVEQAVVDAGEFAVHEIQEHLDNVLVNPTGFYRSRIDFATREDGVARVTDGGVIYGPWLESGGNGTRFRGYATFRRAMQATEAEAVVLADRRLSDAVADLT